MENGSFDFPDVLGLNSPIYPIATGIGATFSNACLTEGRTYSQLEVLNATIPQQFFLCTHLLWLNNEILKCL